MKTRGFESSLMPIEARTFDAQARPASRGGRFQARCPLGSMNGTVPSSERSCSSHLTPEVLRYGPKAYNSDVLSRSVQLERSCG